MRYESEEIPNDRQRLRSRNFLEGSNVTALLGRIVNDRTRGEVRQGFLQNDDPTEISELVEQLLRLHLRDDRHGRRQYRNRSGYRFSILGELLTDRGGNIKRLSR